MLSCVSTEIYQILVKDFHTHAVSLYLSDEQMKSIANQGGVVGIFFSANRELDDDAADAAGGWRRIRLRHPLDLHPHYPREGAAHEGW